MTDQVKQILENSNLIDPFNRHITYLRLSVTDRCDLRCTYCMPEKMTFLNKKEVLSFEEMYKLCSGFIQLGIKKIRITGGEPLVRKGIMDFFEMLSPHLSSQLEELTLTTNGTQLNKYASQLYANGVRRVNISLDTLDPKKFKNITRIGSLQDVLLGIEAAQDADLKIKINCVALKNINDDEVDEFINWCVKKDFDLTFIETMPMGEIDFDRNDQFLPLTLVREELERNWTLEETDFRTGGPARYVTVRETGRKIGFITPLSHNFCEDCNRVRLTCTGKLYMCLGQDDNADLRTVLREKGEEALKEAVYNAINRKPKGHDFIIDRRSGTKSVARHMNVTGG